ncbi:MAG: TRAM domain-containing protein [Candidatus Micrarchaeota archaeon]|nr:TRAM domain-containing protein [Candidatus Micrarchaeota archaeon]
MNDHIERSAGEKPVKEGEEHEVTIESVGAKGDGLARISNFVIFVPGATAGEKTRVKITTVRLKFAIAEKI